MDEKQKEELIAKAKEKYGTDDVRVLEVHMSKPMFSNTMGTIALAVLTAAAIAEPVLFGVFGLGFFNGLAAIAAYAGLLWIDRTAVRAVNTLSLQLKIYKTIVRHLEALEKTMNLNGTNPGEEGLIDPEEENEHKLH